MDNKLTPECIAYWRNAIKYAHRFTKEDAEGYKLIEKLLDGEKDYGIG